MKSNLPPLIRRMLQPGFYPHRPGKVELIQTHVSYVLLAGELVYKVKKPVDFGFLDYSTLRRRGIMCRREVELNSRLAPKIYLHAARIYRRGKEYSLRREGPVVEYAVVMKRLPEKRLLASLMASGKATKDHARRVGRRIASFHKGAAEGAVKNRGISVLRKNLEENFRQTEPYIGRTVKKGDYLFLWRYNREFLRRRRSFLQKRILDGRIRDGHGDLHAGNICIRNDIVIYDCIEFNPRLRQTDTAADTAFLYMDLLYHRHPHLAKAFIEEYLRRSGDWEMRLLLPFYACYRAVVREKVESFRLGDPHLSKAHKAGAARRAARYFHLARDLAIRDSRPRLFTFGGLPGSGKTTLARAWAALIGADCFNSDLVRKEMGGLRPTESGAASPGKGLYTRKITDAVYGELIDRARRSLNEGGSAVVDATFGGERHRRLAAGTAKRAKALFIPIECRCPEKEIRRRLALRRSATSISDADWSIYRALKKSYRPVHLNTLSVDTSRGLDIALKKIAEHAYPL